MTSHARVFEEEGRELTATLNARESVIRDSELEVAELKNRIGDLENMLHTKQKLIESLQTRSPLKSRDDEIQRNVAHLESVITTYRTSEATLRLFFCFMRYPQLAVICRHLSCCLTKKALFLHL